MSAKFPSLLTAVAALAFVGGLWAQEGTDGGLLRVQISAAASEARRGNRVEVAETLGMLLREAEKAGEDRAAAEAQVALAKIVLEADADKEAAPVEPLPLLESALDRCSRRGWTDLKVDALRLHAQCLGELDQAVPGCRDLEAAGSLALDNGRVNDAVEILLQAARIYDHLGHAVKVRQLWTLLGLVKSQRGPQVNEESLARLERAEEDLAMTLSLTPQPKEAPQPGVRLQPLRNAAVVSNQREEDARTRFVLINQSSLPAEGDLSILAEGAGVKSWLAGQNGQFIHLDPQAEAKAGNRHMRLLPGQQVRIYVEHLPLSQLALVDKVSLSWTDADGAQQAECVFRFDPKAAHRSQVVNGNIIKGQAAWPAPLYHEIFYRGSGSTVENFLVQASVPCRVEYYREGTGELIAVDAEGDGVFTGEGDSIAEGFDRDEEGRPDLVLTEETSGSLEVFALPLAGDGQAATISIRLADYTVRPPEWREDAFDSVETP